MPVSPRFLLVALAALLLLIGSLGPADLQAQDDPDDPTLPDIAPREIEVRGDLEVSLPSAERQPLTGFNPPPRIPMVPPDHAPFIGDFQQQPADLPQETLELPELPATLERPQPPMRGELGAGIGRYFSRFANAKLWIPATSTESFTLRADYDGSAGHTPFDNVPDINNPRDTFEGHLGFESQRDPSRFDLDVSGYYDSYALFGRSDGDNPEADAIPDLEGWHINASTGFRSERSVAYGIRGTLSTTDYEVQGLEDAGEVNNAREVNNSEQYLQLRGDLDIPIGPAEARADLDFATTGIDGNTTFEGDTQSLNTGVRVGLFDAPDYTVSAGGRLLMATASADADLGLDERRTKRFVLPTFVAKWFPRDGMTLHLRNRPTLEAASLSNLFQESPYMLPASANVRPTVTTTDLEGGIQFFAGPVELSAKGGYSYAPDFLFFAEGDDNLFSAQYETGEIWHGGAEITLPETSGFTMTLGANVREGQIRTDSDATDGNDIPYFAPVTARASLSYSFNNQQGLVQLTGRYESARYTDSLNEEEVDAFFGVDLEGSYDLTPALGLVARVRNIGTDGTLTRWGNHPQAPFEVSSGLRVRW